MSDPLPQPTDDKEFDNVEMSRLARRYAKEGLACLVLAVRIEDLDMRVRVQAATELLSRGFGRPAQAPALPSYLSVEDLERILEQSRDQNPGDAGYSAGTKGYPDR
jgi:hypothetical protein